MSKLEICLKNNSRSEEKISNNILRIENGDLKSENKELNIALQSSMLKVQNLEADLKTAYQEIDKLRKER